MAGKKPDRVMMTLLMHPADRDLLNSLAEMTGLQVQEVIARSAFAWQIALMAARMPLGSGISVDIHTPTGMDQYAMGRPEE